MDTLFGPVVTAVKKPENGERLRAAIEWVEAEFPQLEHKVAWKQAMFVDHGTFIIGLSASADNLLVAPETAAIAHFAERLDSAGD